MARRSLLATALFAALVHAQTQAPSCLLLCAEVKVAQGCAWTERGL